MADHVARGAVRAQGCLNTACIFVAVRYVNNAGTSWPKPPQVHQAAAAALEAAPHETLEVFDSAHRTVCEALGVPDPDRLLLTSGCTAALGVALGDLPWQAGDVIVTSSLEHHALARPVDKLVRERGVVHHAAPYEPGTPMDMDFVRDVLKAGGVRLVATTAASNVTGELLPLAELGALAHEHGALQLVDAAQTVGLLPVDVAKLGADIVTFAGHKGPLGPQGIGGLWARPGVSFESPWATCDIGTGSGDRGACSPFPGYCDVGSVNLSGAAGLAAGLRWLTENPERPGRAVQLAQDLAAALRERDGCTVLGGEDTPRTGTLAVQLARLPLAQTEAFFRQHDIVVRAGSHCAPMALEALGAPDGVLRLSFGPFNDDDDVQAILNAVDDVGR